VTATNAISGQGVGGVGPSTTPAIALREGIRTAEVSSFAYSLPGKPHQLRRISTKKTDSTNAEIILAWYPLTDTGGVPLTGYKLYAYHVLTQTTALAYDGTNKPETLQADIKLLKLDNDY